MKVLVTLFHACVFILLIRTFIAIILVAKDHSNTALV
jgi:hypothetical protein